jgi:hypothetical protein
MEQELKDAVVEAYLAINEEGKIFNYAKAIKFLKEKFPDKPHHELHDAITSSADDIISIIEAQRLIQ